MQKKFFDKLMNLSIHVSHRRNLRQIMLGLVLLGLIQLISWMTPVPESLNGIASFLPLHTLFETVAIVIAMLVFAVGWNSHSRTLSGNIVLLACVFFAVGWLDFSHTLSYKGMPDFVTPSDPEKGLDFWLAARFIASLALLFVTLRPWKPFTSAATRYVLMGAGVVVILFANWLVLFHQNLIPRTFIPGQGLTQLKINLEYLFITLNIITALVLLFQMRKPLPFDAPLLFGAVCVMAMSEFFFTLYASVTDIFNILGHSYKVIAYLLIYRAIVVEGIETPYKKLNEAQQNLALAVKASNTGLWSWRINTNEVYYSPEWKAQLGYKEDELPDTFLTWETMIHPEDKEQAMQRMQNYIASPEKSYENEFRLRHRDGSYRWILVRGETHLDNQGQVELLIGSHIDITERKHAEAELNEYRLHLEEQVAIRTVELSTALKAAELANNAKSEFLSRMSHELRTPLNAILGFGQILEMDKPPTLNAQQADNVKEILIAGHHLLELINEVLDLSRIESGRLELTLTRLKIASLIESCVRQVTPLAMARGIIIEMEIDHALTIVADERRLKQVVLNLLSNAIKYNKENGTIRINSTQADSASIRIQVTDTGIGIGANDLERIFRPFERLVSAYAGIEGSGIGLALAQNLVIGMHGNMGVESEVGKGSTFWFELPA